MYSCGTCTKIFVEHVCACSGGCQKKTVVFRCLGGAESVESGGGGLSPDVLRVKFCSFAGGVSNNLR